MNYIKNNMAALCAIFCVFSFSRVTAEPLNTHPALSKMIMSDKVPECEFYTEHVVTLKQKKASKGKGGGTPPSVHRVKAGETLYSISRQYGITVSELKRLNRLKVNTITPGMTLKLTESGVSRNSSQPQRSGNKKISGIKKPGPSFIWPVGRGRDSKRDGGSGVNPIGIVITADSGSPVLCSAPGVVDRIGYMRGYGDYIIVKHANGYSTVYSNIASIMVKEGQRINGGTTIGRVSPDSRIHFQIDNCGRPENPLNYLPGG